VFFADRVNGKPEYMSYTRIEEPFRGNSQNDPIGGNTVLGQLLLSGQGFSGTGSYLQHTIDDGWPFETNGDGSLKIVNGELVWRTDKRTVTINGQSCILYKGDYYEGVCKRYELEARDLTNVYFRAGSQDLALSTYRKTGYENVRFSSQFRLDGEVQSAIDGNAYSLNQTEIDSLNYRPLNADYVRDNAHRMYFNTDYVRGWMRTQEVTEMGSDHGPEFQSRASAEMCALGFMEAARFNWIFDTPYKPIEPKLWIDLNYADHTSAPYEQFYRKPIIRGGLAIKGGKTDPFPALGSDLSKGRLLH